MFLPLEKGLLSDHGSGQHKWLEIHLLYDKSSQNHSISPFPFAGNIIVLHPNFGLRKMVDHEIQNSMDVPYCPGMKHWALDAVISLLALAAFICILTAFSGSYIDDENVFHAVVMFIIFFVEGLAAILSMTNFWNIVLPNPGGLCFIVRKCRCLLLNVMSSMHGAAFSFCQPQQRLSF